MGNKDFQNVVIPPKIAGIKSVLPTYLLAWQINKSFGIEMSLNLDWNKVASNGKTSLHHHYYCYFEDVELNWHLVDNKGSEAWFFQSKPMFDYLLVCNGEDIYGYFERAVDAIKTNSKIEHIYPFDFEILPKKEPFYNNILRTKYFLEDLHV